MARVGVVLLGLLLVDGQLVAVDHFMRLEVFFVSEALLAGIHWLHGLSEGVRLIFIASYLAQALTTFAA